MSGNRKNLSLDPRISRNDWPASPLKRILDVAEQRSGNLDGMVFPVPSAAVDEMQEVPLGGNVT